MIKKLLALALLVCIPAASFGALCVQCDLDPVQIFDTGTAEPVAIAYSPDCNLLAAALISPAGSNIIVYPVNPDCSLGAGSVIATLPNASGAGAYQTVAFSPTGRCLAAGDSLGNVTMFSVSPAAPTCTIAQVLEPFATGGDNVRGIAFSPTGTCLATANYSSSTVSLFRVQTNCTLTPLSLAVPTGDIQPTSVAFSPSGTCLITTNNVLSSPAKLGSLSIFSVTTDEAGNCALGAPTVFIDNANIVTPEQVTFSPTGNCVAIASGIGNGQFKGVALYTLTDPCTLTVIPVIPPRVRPDEYAPAAAFSPIGSCLAIAENFNNQVTIVTINTTGEESCTVNNAFPQSSFPVGTDESPELSPRALAFSPDSQCLAVANRTNSISIFRTNILIPPVIISAEASCNELTAVVTGTASPGVDIVLFDENNNEIGFGTADPVTGAFTIITSTLTPGLHTITAAARRDTCESARSNSVQVNIILLGVPAIIDIRTTCFDVRISGTVTVNPANIPVTITILVDGNPVASGPAVITNPNNPFSRSFSISIPTSSISSGSHMFIARAQANGCIVDSDAITRLISLPPACNFGAAPNLTICNVPCPPQPCPKPC